MGSKGEHLPSRTCLPPPSGPLSAWPVTAAHLVYKSLSCSCPTCFSIRSTQACSPRDPAHPALRASSAACTLLPPYTTSGPVFLPDFRCRLCRRFFQLQDANTIGLYTVLPAGCSDASRAAALRANDPATLLAQRLADSAADLAAMKARLDAVQPIRAALLAEGGATLTIKSLSASSPVVVMGKTGNICYSIPPSANVNPKGLVLFVGTGGSGSYYTDALGAANGPLPDGPKRCTAFTVSLAVPPGPYTIALEDSSSGTNLAVVSFTARRP
jgi:hypothetical protein